MNKLQTRFTFLFFGLLFFVLASNNKSQWNQLPNGYHTWTQSDHFALTNGFVSNGLDFFHPQTKIYAVYNQDFPNNWKTADSTTITSVDFPIHQYIPAVMMKVFQSKSPLFSQLYYFLLGFIGLFFVFRFAFFYNQSVIISAVVTCFVCFSPIYTYYSIRFIPSIPSFSLAIIGIYYYFKYRKNEQNTTSIRVAICLLTLGALSRMTFLIPLLCVLGIELFRLLKKNGKQTQLKWILGISSVLVFTGYFLYNAYLKETYGTLFLAALNPAKSFAEFKEIIHLVIHNWKWEYFTGYHYGIVVCVLLFSGIHFIQSKSEKRTGFETASCLFLFVGSAIFFLAMSAQFVHHDYYFIDNFLLPVVVFLCVFSRHLVVQTGFLKLVILSILLLGVVGMYFSNNTIQKNRSELEKWGEYATIENDFSDSKKLLQKLGIPNSNKLLLLMSTAPNYALNLLDRSAYVSLKNDPKRLKRILQFDFDYVIFQNEWFMREIYANNPSVIEQFKTVGTNGKITVCKLDHVPNQTIYSLFQLNNRVAKISAVMNTKTAIEFKNTALNSAAEDSIWTFNPLDEFGPMINIKSKQIFQINRFVLVEGECRLTDQSPLSLVVSTQEQQKTTLYKSFPIEVEKSGAWKKFRFFVTIPPRKSTEVDFAAYLYNPNHVAYAVRKLKMIVY